MPSVPQFLLLSFLAAILITLNFASPAVSAVVKRDVAVEEESTSFQQLLNTVSEDTLHAMLHLHLPPKYQHGVFPKDKAAIEAVHNVDPPMATRLLRLAKRQNVTSTSSSILTSSVLSTTSLTSSSSTPSPSSSQSLTGSVTSSASSNLSTSLSTSSSSSSSPDTQTTSSSSSAASSISSDSGITTSTTSRVLSSTTSLILSTTTLSNGDRSTVTQVTVVGVTSKIATPSGNAGVSTTATGAPGLQTGASNKNAAGIMGAVVGGAMVGFLVW
ncbi:MAG: hypothetical protein M1829_004113 [Trizodia sp. TS-e1964]|nr:MAG: hypothetical protein M1829_004113 [Trizodia sp. TS-e1964]